MKKTSGLLKKLICLKPKAHKHLFGRSFLVTSICPIAERTNKMKALWYFSLCVCAIAPLSVANAIVFQEGLDGYSGTVDTYLAEWSPDNDLSHGGEEKVVIHHGGTNRAHGLLRFEDIETDLMIVALKDHPHFDAKLYIQVIDAGLIGANVYQMKLPWQESDTWNKWGDGQDDRNTEGGIQHDDQEAFDLLEATLPIGGPQPGSLVLDVTDTVKNWVRNGDPNYGWAILPLGTDTDGWHFASSEHPELSLRPKLVITPEPASLSLLALGVIPLIRRRR